VTSSKEIPLLRSVAGIILVLIGAPVWANQPCTPPICELTTAAGRQQCMQKADWIIEATVDQIGEQYERTCEGSGCSSLWAGSTVRFAEPRDRIKVIKGTFQWTLSGAIRPPGPVEIVSASHCFGDLVRLRPEMVGKRIRLFGIDRSVGPNTRPGFFAFDLVHQ
jgi:hypothetical protein